MRKVISGIRCTTEVVELEVGCIYIKTEFKDMIIDECTINFEKSFSHDDVDYYGYSKAGFNGISKKDYTIIDVVTKQELQVKLRKYGIEV